MKNRTLQFFTFIVFIFICFILSSGISFKDFIYLEYPDYWDSPTYDFEKNPLTKEGIELGRKLFYDPLLSRNNTISCSSCHLSYTAFTHIDHTLSHGINDRIGIRNTPALMNLAWSKHFMWDGAVNHLDVQALAPITHPDEMDESIENVIKKLQRTNHYPNLFFDAFGDSIITTEFLLKAISQFELTFISANSKYDQVVRGDYKFTKKERRGYTIFKNNCASCHTEPFFTNHDFAHNGLPVDIELLDFGRMRITQNPDDSLKFKVPTLRNIEFSFPYMHDGRFKNLHDVIHHYSETTALEQKVILSTKDKKDLMAFLVCLTDKEFLYNTGFAFPNN